MGAPEHADRRSHEPNHSGGPAPSAGLVQIGSIGRPHGVQGEISVHLITDRTDRLDPGTRLLAGDAWITVVRSRRANQRFLVDFDVIDDRDTAARYTGTPLFAEPVDDPDALWAHELVGSAVATPDGEVHGTCVAVVANPASDLIELDSGVLVPSVFVTGVDDGTVVVDPPPGLLTED